MAFARFRARPLLGALAAALVIFQGQLLIPAFAEAASVCIGERPIFSLSASREGQSIEETVQTIQKNLDNALVASSARGPNAVKVIYVNGTPVITYGGYQVVAVDAEDAKAAGMAQSALARKWADSIRNAVADGPSLDRYMEQLVGVGGSADEMALAPQAAEPVLVGQAPSAPIAAPMSQSLAPSQVFQSPNQGMMIAAGTVLPATLRSPISTVVAKDGDPIEAQLIRGIPCSEGVLPPGTLILGRVTEADRSGRFNRAGELVLCFDRIRTPDGSEAPIAARLLGDIGDYSQLDCDTNAVVRGETWKAKFGQGIIRTAVGAGAGAALGTAVGAISGSVGKGVWSGAAIGAGVGAIDGAVLRKGREVNLQSGTEIQVELEQPARLPGPKGELARFN